MPATPHRLRAGTRSPRPRITRPPQLLAEPRPQRSSFSQTLCYTRFARFYLNPVMSLSPVSEIVCAHSPDSDDAFMFYGLATKKVRSKLLAFHHVLEDIESLNRKATEGLYELTAISYHAYPYVADKNVLMASGSSIGDGYGPMVVSTRHMKPEDLKGKRIAVPGTMTTAFLTLKLFQPDFEAVVIPFDM